MSIFDFDDPNKNAEDRMSSAFACVVLCGIAAVALVVVIGWLLVRSW